MPNPIHLANPIHFAVASVVLMTIAFLAVVGIYFLKNRHKWLVWICVVVFFIALLGFRLSILPWFFALPSMVEAAVSSSVSGFSTSYLAIAGAVFLAAWAFVFSILERGAIWHLTKDWKKSGKSFLWVSSGTVILWMVVILGNFHKVYEALIIPSSGTRITWTHPSEIQLVGDWGPVDLTGYLQEYVVEVTAMPQNTMPTSVTVRFQFPYVVELKNVEPGGIANAAFSPVKCAALVFKSDEVKTFGQMKYRDYNLVIPEMPLNGKVRILVVLNSSPNPGGRSILVGKIPENMKNVPHRDPLSGPAEKVEGPLREYIETWTEVLYGGQKWTAQITYTPFQESSDKIVTIGQFTQPPKGVGYRCEP